MSTHEGNINYLDFYIPQGKTGKTEVLRAGYTIQVDPRQIAKVSDRYEKGEHFLDFYIPQGEQGDKGEKGDKGDKGDKGISQKLSVACTYTIDPLEPARVEDEEIDNEHHLAFYIPRGAKGEKGDQGEVGPQGMQGIQGIRGEQGEQGPVGPQGMQGVAGPKGDTGAKGDKGDTGPVGPQGPKGEQGVAGPPGTTGTLPNINATIYNDQMLSLDNDATITLDKTLASNGVRVVGNAIIAPEEGTYLVMFSINSGTQVQAGDSVVVAVNSIKMDATKRPISTTVAVTSASILNLKMSDSVSLIPEITNSITISNNGAPSATLTVLKVSGKA